MYKIVILLPCYNEESSVAKVISDWQNVLPEAEIWFCDNNSSDNSAKIAESLSVNVVFEKNQGKGAAIKALLSHSIADIYIMCDVDNTYPPTTDIITPLINGRCDMCIGDRTQYYFSGKHNFLNGIGNRVVSHIYSRLCEREIEDPLSGLRAFNRTFADFITDRLSNGFEIEAEMLFYAIKYQYKVNFVPIKYQNRRGKEKSKINVFKDGYKILKRIMELKHEF